MDPMAEEQLDYGDDDLAGNPKPAAAIPALADEYDEFDDLYNDVNVGDHFSHSQNPNPNPAVEQNHNPPNPNNFNASRENLELQRPPTAAAVPPQKLAIDLNPNHGNHSNFNNSNDNLGFQRGAMVPNSNEVQLQRQVVGAVDPSGPTMVFVGELQWWTTDADLENVLSRYGRVKEIKFFDERASGKSKGYCQVEFCDAFAAAACKDGMNGYEFHGKACVVAFASPQTLRQMGANYVNRNPGQGQSQQQNQPMRRPNDNNNFNNNNNNSNNFNNNNNNGGRSFGRGNWNGGRGNQGMMNRVGGQGGNFRGRGFNGGRFGNNGGFNGGRFGNNDSFGGGMNRPMGMMHAQNMMGAGFDPGYMGRGGPYGGFAGPGFAGMMPPFQAVNAMGLPGVAPHVNPAFFGRGMAMNGMGMMGNGGMEGQMWGDAGMSGNWNGDEASYDNNGNGDDNGGGDDYGYGEVSHDRVGRSNTSKEERGSENYDRKHHSEKVQDQDWEKERHREEKDGHRGYKSRDRDYDGEDEYYDERGQSSRSRSKSRVQEDDHRSRSRDADYGKRRRE